jgi:PGF-pre-PGF domain-containing protein
MKWPEIKIAFMLILALTLFTVPASAGSVERVLPASVNAGEEFQVTVNVADYGAAGQLLEKLPQGFTFVGSTLPERAVNVNGDGISFLLIDEKSFSYTLKAASSTDTYKFTGLLRDVNKADFPVLPADSSIEVRVPSSGGSLSNSDGNYGSSSGSNGAGSSSESQDNVEARELSQEFITNGQHVKFEFPKGSTCIRYVEFDPRKTPGKVTTAAEMLKGRSKLVSSLPAGEVYKNVNIWIETGEIASSDNIENATIGFRVEKAWLKKSGNNSSFAALWHYDTAWSKLETQKVGEDSTYIYFEAITPGFGHFVIAVNNESTNLKSSGSTYDNPLSPTNSGAKEIFEPDKRAGKSTNPLPGFESAVSVCILGAGYCILRRKN